MKPEFRGKAKKHEKITSSPKLSFITADAADYNDTYIHGFLFVSLSYIWYLIAIYDFLFY